MAAISVRKMVNTRHETGAGGSAITGVSDVAAVKACLRKSRTITVYLSKEISDIRTEMLHSGLEMTTDKKSC
jgi:hypothetical protein